MKKLVILFIVSSIISSCATTISRTAFHQNSKLTNKERVFVRKKGDEVRSSTTKGNVYRDCPIVGAIRWDAWYGDQDLVGKSQEMNLRTEHWHYRLPFCAEVLGKNNVRINCATQAVMDQEIAYAQQAGIDYWAFIDYETFSPTLSLALKNYLSSTNKSNINFAVIAENRWWTPETYKKGIDHFIQHMKDPSYQMVFGKRPLIYLFNFREDWIAKNWKEDSAFKQVINEFRLQVQNAGLGNPYIVIMDFNPDKAKQLVDRFGFDAISTYAVAGSPGEGLPYKRLANRTERYWDSEMATGAQVVPTVMTGWDKRDVFENKGFLKVKDSFKKYFNTPKPIELGQHLKNALEWVRNKSDYAQANTVIIYAWNEHTEGGWIAPTLSEGTARLDALGEVIRRDCPAKR